MTNTTTYTLRRTLPNGEVREQGPFKRPRDAAKAAFYVLYDNHQIRAEAQVAPLEKGEAVEVAGYRFELVPA